MSEYELSREYDGIINPEFANQSSASGSMRTIPGPISVPEGEMEDDNGNMVPSRRSSDPLHFTGSDKVQLKSGSSYRLIGSDDMWFRMVNSEDDATGVNTDIYVPAKTPVTISVTSFVWLAVKSAGGFWQAVEVK